MIFSPDPRPGRFFTPAKYRSYFMLAGLFCLFTGRVSAQQNVQEIYSLAGRLTFPSVSGWRAMKGEVPEAQDPGLDDSGWEQFSYQEVLGAEQCWFRVELELPKTIALQPVGSSDVWLRLEVQNHGRVYLDGKAAGALVPGENRLTLKRKAGPVMRVKVAVHLQARHQRVIFRGAALELAAWREAVETAEKLHLTIFTAARMLNKDTHQRGLMIQEDPGIDRSTVGEDSRGELWQELDKALGIVDRRAVEKGDPAAFVASVGRAFAGMDKLAAHLRSYRLYLVSNAHIDVAWLWRWRETVEATHDTFDSVLELMKQYPELTFSQSQAQLYQWMEQYYPELFDRIAARVEQGRWEVVGGMWVEPDCNLISGESWVCQLLYGKSYFRQRFGKEVTFGWNPDSFGYNWNMPQFFSKAGIGAFLTQKLLWNDTSLFPYHLFWWKGPDGSRILVYFPYSGYTNVVNPYQMVDDLRQFEANTGLRSMAVLIGYGDHGGGPQADMLERARGLRELPVFPRVEFGTAEGYLAALDDSVKAALPEYSDELYLEYHRGTYTSQARMKEMNRRLEVGLGAAETLSSLNSLLGSSPYPAGPLERAWKMVLFNQMHDILPGSGIAAVYHDAGEKYAEAWKLVESLTRRALLGLAGRIETDAGAGGEPLVVFNVLGWPRSGVVHLQGEPGELEGCRIYDNSGRRLHSQLVHTDQGGAGLIFRAEQVPPAGYRVFRLRRGPDRGDPPGENTLQATVRRLENEFFLLELDPASGLVTRLYDKRHRREALAPGGVGNLLELFEDRPEQWDAWNIGYTGVEWKLDRADLVEVAETGPVRATVRVKRSFLGPTKARRRLATSFPSSFFTTEISLYAGEPVIEVRNSFDWWEERILCKVAWELGVQSDTAYYEIPMAAIGRPTTRETPRDKARFEVPALSWADLSGPGYGVSLISRSKHGYDVEGSRLRHTLLRSPAWPDPAADRGRHEFSYALYPHSGDWRQGGTVRAAREYCTPLYLHHGVSHPGSLPADSAGFLAVEPENVVVSAFKAAEDGDGFVLRCYEAHGRRVSARVKLPAPLTKAEEIDLLERPVGAVAVRERSLSFELGPYEIKGFRLQLGQTPHQPTQPERAE
ncbi:MAG: alpha-mannosidase [Candidatus Glassbacteria bacterium]|nr:alpha-mannosidase [Candidatus Glassbacteria bacterium]